MQSTMQPPVFRGRLWAPPPPASSGALAKAATREVAAAHEAKVQRSAERRRRRTAYPLSADRADVQAQRAAVVGSELLAYRQRMFAHGRKHALPAAPSSEARPVDGCEESAQEALDAKLRRLVSQHEVMLFMKGTLDKPRCGLSRRAAGLLEEAGIEFGSFDVFSDEEVRQGLKALSNRPTYPQLYARGEFVGGLAALQQLAASGELVGTLRASTERSRSEMTPPQMLTRHVTLDEIQIPSPSRQKPRGASEPSVRLTIQEQGKLGLSLGPSIDTADSVLQVKSVAPDGLAAAAVAEQGTQLAGLVLSEVMGQATAGMEHKAVLQHIKRAKRPLSLGFSPVPTLATTINAGDGADERRAAGAATGAGTSAGGAAADEGVSITWGVCGHLFHADTIKRWMETHDSCPVCSRRWELDRTTQLHGAEQQRVLAELAEQAHVEWARRHRADASGAAAALLPPSVDGDGLQVPRIADQHELLALREQRNAFLDQRAKALTKAELAAAPSDKKALAREQITAWFAGTQQLARVQPAAADSRELDEEEREYEHMQELNARESRQKTREAEAHLMTVAHIPDEMRVSSRGWSQRTPGSKAKTWSHRSSDLATPFKNAAGQTNSLGGSALAVGSRAAPLDAADSSVDFIQGEPPHVGSGVPCVVLIFSTRGPQQACTNPPDPATGRARLGGLEGRGIEQLYEAWRPCGLQVAAITRCGESEAVRNFVDCNQLSFPVAVDTSIDAPSSVYEQYHVRGERLPRAVVCDGSGAIVWRGHPLDKKLEQAVAHLYETDPYIRGQNLERLRAAEKIQARRRGNAERKRLEVVQANPARK
jgi:Grx4 family monothiol glutaredoxin